MFSSLYQKSCQHPTMQECLVLVQCRWGLVGLSGIRPTQTRWYLCFFFKIISRMPLQNTNILKEAKNKHNNQALSLTSQSSNLTDLPGPPLSPGWWCAHMLMTASLPKATWGHSHPFKPSHRRLCSKYGLLSANLPLGTNNFPDNKTSRITHIHHNTVMIHIESKNTM